MKNATPLVKTASTGGLFPMLVALYTGDYDRLIAAARRALERYHATLGDKDAAFAWLDKAYAARSPTLIMLEVFPVYAPLRDDPRFAALVKRVGLQ